MPHQKQQSLDDTRQARKRQFRWRQLSLRHLLILTAAIGVFLGLFAARIDEARKRYEAVNAIVAAGGRVMFRWQFDSATKGLPLFGLEPPATGWPWRVFTDCEFHEVETVFLGNSRASFDGNQSLPF